jgi:hypothetical protein
MVSFMHWGKNPLDGSQVWSGLLEKKTFLTMPGTRPAHSLSLSWRLSLSKCSNVKVNITVTWSGPILKIQREGVSVAKIWGAVGETGGGRVCLFFPWPCLSPEKILVQFHPSPVLSTYLCNTDFNDKNIQCIPCVPYQSNIFADCAVYIQLAWWYQYCIIISLTFQAKLLLYRYYVSVLNLFYILRCQPVLGFTEHK